MADENEMDAYYEPPAIFLGIPRAFIVNEDDSGFTDYTDVRPETVAIPTDYPFG
jgi:hypothetical protein